MADLNELLIEAGQRAEELSARAAAGAAAAHDIVTHAQAIGLKAVEEGERLHREYTEAITAIKHAGEQAGLSAEAAAEALESLAPETQKAAQAVTHMLQAVEDDMSHLAQERARVLHELDEAARKAKAGFHDLAVQVAAFDEHAEKRLQECDEALKHIDQAAGLANTRIRTARENMELAMHAVSNNASHSSSVAAHGVDQVVAALGIGVLKFSNAGITGHNHAVAAVVHGYLDASPADPEPESGHTYLGPAFDKLRDALHAFQGVTEPTGAVLQSGKAAVLGETEKVVNGLDGVVRELEHSHGVVTS